MKPDDLGVDLSGASGVLRLLHALGALPELGLRDDGLHTILAHLVERGECDPARDT